MLCSSHPSIVHQEVCVRVRACVRMGGEAAIKSFLITHLSHEKHSTYFVWALAVWLIQQPSHSDCSLYTKLPLLSVFSSASSPISFSSLRRLVLDSSGFSFECTDVCLPDPLATEASFSLGIRGLTAHIGCQRSTLDNDDRTIRVDGNALLLAVCVAL